MCAHHLDRLLGRRHPVAISAAKSCCSRVCWRSRLALVLLVRRGAPLERIAAVHLRLVRVSQARELSGEALTLRACAVDTVMASL